MADDHSVHEASDRKFSPEGGGQALLNEQLRILQRIAIALETPNRNAFAVYPWIADGNIVITDDFPTIQAGVIAIRKTTPAATQLTLPIVGGPYIICDALGDANSNNITVIPTSGSGQTIDGGSSYVINTNWDQAWFLLDKNGNYLTL